MNPLDLFSLAVYALVFGLIGYVRFYWDRREIPGRYSRIDSLHRGRTALWGVDDKVVAKVFAAQWENSAWFKWKVEGLEVFDRLLAKLFAEDGCQRNKRAWPDKQNDWKGILAGGRHLHLICRPSFRVGGWASTDHPNSCRIVLGMEWWLCKIPWLKNSAAAHELIHCAQQAVDGRLQAEWSIEPNPLCNRDKPIRERIPVWWKEKKLRLRTEAPALAGSSLWVACVLAPAVAPISRSLYLLAWS